MENITETTQPVLAAPAWGKRLSGLVKRGFDILAAALGLLALSPLFLYVALRLRRDSPGPVFYRGRRAGRWGREFKILKFRTMYERPESYAGPAVTASGDSRVTPFGRWLRRTKINELPQLWNVLIGEMSLVGPRPEDPEIAAGWPEDVRAEVLSVRPGITSPASVIYRDEENLLSNGDVMNEYVQSILPEKLRLDQLYVRHHNLSNDLDILLTTLVTLLPPARQAPVRETTLYSGPITFFLRRYIPWYFADTLTALFAIGLVGVIWRLQGPLNLGLARAFGIAVGAALLLSVTNTIFGLKQVAWRYASLTYLIDLALSTGLAVAALTAIDARLFKTPPLPVHMIWDFGLLTYLGFAAVRFRERILAGLASRWLAMRGQRTAFGERVLIIGAGECGELAVWLLKKSRYARAFTIVGFVDDDYEKQNSKVNAYPILGTTREIGELVERNQIGLILFAINKVSAKERERILAACRKTAARLVIVPDLMAPLENLNLEPQNKEKAK